MDSKGQITYEYLILVGITIMITLMISNYLTDAHELNMAMTAARSGALSGSNINGFAIYSKSIFNEYETEKPKITAPSSIKIVKIESKNQGYNNNYKKTKIQLKVYASCAVLKNSYEKNSVGDRINYNVRRSICKIFKTENSTNALFNPVFSPKFVFTTADVIWV
ncbi:hypothetical protein [Methanobacterium alcaliphilum]|uniref:hypothetical protein n=1 Tax=Methanobacterium alcaliphilum TaxID=392018 RepID=UPI00200AEB78|nr:hypothetical protein [Methanobacterium alcaliphilum]MCK9152478.1 hypothetical protein [Methanobacterium alcaliphilum]